MKEQLKKWLTEICRWDKSDLFIQWLEETSSPDEYRAKVHIYTRDNEYRITAKDHKSATTTYGRPIRSPKPKESRTYLGCTVSCRKPRAGEGHTRGNDLPDGSFCRETWDKIKNAIIAYELVKISKPKRSEPVAENTG